MTETAALYHEVPEAIARHEATHTGGQEAPGRDGHRPVVDVDNNPSPWLTVAEAAKVVKCGRRLIYQEVKAGRLRAARLGLRRDIRVHRDWIREWLERCAAPVEVTR